METIEIELSDFSLRCRSAVVSHVSTSLPRGLEPGEQVVLHDSARGRFSAHVADIDFEASDTVYRLEVGVRLTEAEATERLHSSTAPAAGAITKQDVLDLLGELRATGSTLPAGRRGRGARVGTAL